MKKRKEKPCGWHRLAMPNWNFSEIKGMEGHGLTFQRCKSCGWIVRSNEEITSIVETPSERKRTLAFFFAGVLLALASFAFFLMNKPECKYPHDFIGPLLPGECRKVGD